MSELTDRARAKERKLDADASSFRSQAKHVDDPSWLVSIAVVDEADAQLIRDLIAEVERLRPTDRQLEAVGRLAAWVRDFGHAKEPAFIADVAMLIEAIKGDE